MGLTIIIYPIAIFFLLIAGIFYVYKWKDSIKTHEELSKEVHELCVDTSLDIRDFFKRNKKLLLITLIVICSATLFVAYASNNTVEEVASNSQENTNPVIDSPVPTIEYVVVEPEEPSKSQEQIEKETIQSMNRFYDEITRR